MQVVNYYSSLQLSISEHANPLSSLLLIVLNLKWTFADLVQTVFFSILISCSELKLSLYGIIRGSLKYKQEFHCKITTTLSNPYILFLNIFTLYVDTTFPAFGQFIHACKKYFAIFPTQFCTNSITASFDACDHCLPKAFLKGPNK